jgi:beta-phosphoglucomutase
MKKKNKLAIFDLDGTLFDTKDVNFLSYRTALAELGYDLDYDFFCTECNGRLYKDFIPKIVTDINEEILSNIHKRKKELYLENLNAAKMNKHLFDIATALKEEYALAVVTTASKKNTLEILEYYKKKDLFDLIITQEDIQNTKPDPEGFLKAMLIFNIKPENTIIFEDSNVGVEAAKRSNANVFIVDKF